MNPNMNLKHKSTEIGSQLLAALDRHELELYFQPIVELGTCRTRGFEALVRWNHPERGLLGAGEIIPPAEQLGLMPQIGTFILQEAIRIAATWPRHLRLAINVSAQQFKTGELARCIRLAAAEYHLAPYRIEIELTETALVADIAATRKSLQQLARLGCRIALDDFGTGYSSLSHILDLHVHRLKIDRAFVAPVLQSNACATLVRALAHLADELSLGLTAEGVETQEQLAFLRQIECEEAQGYLFSPPREARELPNLYFHCLPILGKTPKPRALSA